MITSIVPLPNFFNSMVSPMGTGPVLSGLMSCYTGDNEVYLPDNVELSQSRNLHLHSVFYKYKIRVVPNPGQPLEAYIVIVSAQPLDYTNGVYGNRGNIVEIYPLYAVICNPLLTSNRSRVVLSCEAINRFFGHTNIVCSPNGTKTVESTYQYVWSIMHTLEGRGVDQTIRHTYTYLNRDENFPVILGSLCGSDGNYNNMEDFYVQKYAIRNGELPYDIVRILDAQLSSDLQPLMNPYFLNLDEASLAAVSSQQSWAELSSKLTSQDKLFMQSTDNILPCTPEDESKMGSALTKVFEVPHEDFWFDINTDCRDVTDKYMTSINMFNGFGRDTFIARQGDVLSFAMMYACDLYGRFRDTRLRMHRSYMEDIAIYDKDSNQLLLYIDMVWWTLIAAPGLINSGNSASF